VSVSHSPGPVWRNFVVSLTSEVLGQAVAFLVGIYLARTLGPAGFGTWVFAASIVLYAAVLVDGGTELWGMREIGSHPQRVKKTVLSVLKLRLAFCLLSIAVVGTMAAFLDPERRLALVFGLTSLVALVLSTSFAHRGLESLSPAFANLVQRLAMLALTLYFVREPGDAAQVTLWQGVSELAAAVFLLAALAPRLRASSAKPDPGHGTDVLRAAWPLGASRALRSLPTACASVVLGLSWSNVDVGNYGVAGRISGLLLVVSGVFHNSTFPAVARACMSGGEAEVRVLAATFRLLAIVLTPLAIGGAVLAHPLILAIFSDRFAPAAVPLAILLGAFYLMALSDLVRRVLVARHRQRLDLILTAVATAFSLFAIAGLTPWIGVVGSAMAMLAGEFVLLAFCKRALDRSGARVSLLRALAAPALVSGVMGACVFALRHEALWVSVAAGTAIYLVYLWLIRTRILSDLRQLEFMPNAAARAPASDA